MTINKQTCPTCGQSANEREIALFSGMVESLFRVWQWCQEKNIHEFSRQEIKQFLLNENESARWGDWIMFGGLVYSIKKGHFGINGPRVSDFFAGKLPIPATILKNPLKPKGEQLLMGNPIYISEVPNITTFLDDNQEFITRYVGQVNFQPRPQYSIKYKHKRLKKGQSPCPACKNVLFKRMETEVIGEANSTMAVKEYFICKICEYDSRVWKKLL